MSERAVTKEDESTRTTGQAVSCTQEYVCAASNVPSTVEVGLGESNEKAPHPDVVKRDFCLLPIPKYLWYNPDSPTKFDVLTNVLFGVAATCSE